MSDKPPKKSDPYLFDPNFEAAVIALCCISPRFWSRIGASIEVGCLTNPSARLALEAAKAVAKDTQRGPEGPSIVLQRLAKWSAEDGRVQGPQIRDVAIYLNDAFDRGLPSEDAVVTELRPILARRLRSEAVDSAVDEYAKGGDFARTQKLIEKANTVGDSQLTIGTRLGLGSFEEIANLRSMERLPTGILELDLLLDGGMMRGELGLYVGGFSDGKSMALSAQAAHALRSGLFVVYATLELSVPRVNARIKAALTGTTINAILADPWCVAPQLSRTPLGPCIVQHFTPAATTMQDIETWVSQCEDVVGRPVDVLCTDYGDKLVAPKGAGSKDDASGYTMGRVVFERMRIYADERPQGKCWHWSASQARRRDKSGRGKAKQRLDGDDLADSQHKVRVADLVVTLNYDEEARTMDAFVAKYRNGTRGRGTGPLPSDMACGRVAPWTIGESE